MPTQIMNGLINGNTAVQIQRQNYTIRRTKAMHTSTTDSANNQY